MTSFTYLYKFPFFIKHISYSFVLLNIDSAGIEEKTVSRYREERFCIFNNPGIIKSSIFCEAITRLLFFFLPRLTNDRRYIITIKLLITSCSSSTITTVLPSVKNLLFINERILKYIAFLSFRLCLINSLHQS